MSEEAPGPGSSQPVLEGTWQVLGHGQAPHLPRAEVASAGDVLVAELRLSRRQKSPPRWAPEGGDLVLGHAG